MDKKELIKKIKKEVKFSDQISYLNYDYISAIYKDIFNNDLILSSNNSSNTSLGFNFSLLKMGTTNGETHKKSLTKKEILIDIILNEEKINQELKFFEGNFSIIIHDREEKEIKKEEKINFSNDKGFSTENNEEIKSINKEISKIAIFQHEKNRPICIIDKKYSDIAINNFIDTDNLFLKNKYWMASSKSYIIYRKNGVFEDEKSGIQEEYVEPLVIINI